MPLQKKENEFTKKLIDLILSESEGTMICGYVSITLDHILDSTIQRKTVKYA